MRDVIRDRKRVAYSACAILGLLTCSARSLTLPPDPNNASLLYYQAFLLCPEPDPNTRNLIGKAFYGPEPPDEQIREYIETCRTAITYADAASRVLNCDWGSWYSQGLACRFTHLVPLRLLSEVVSIDARILAADGKYRAAIDRYLAVYAMARHIGNEGEVPYTLSMEVVRNAQRHISETLGLMPPDVETLTWLKDQLATMRPVSRSPVRALEMDFGLAIQTMRTNNKTLPRIRRVLAEASDDGSSKDLRGLADEELLARLRKPYDEFLESVLRVMNSEMLYEEGEAEIKRLTDVLREEVKNDPIVKQVETDIMTLAESAPGLYHAQVLNTARFNAFSVALEIYLIEAQSGRMPKALPDGAPKDRFTRQDFDYEVTGDRFVLRCPVKDENFNPKYHLYEFKLPKR